MDIEERFLTLTEIATALKVDVRVVRALIDSGEMRGFQVGRQWRVEVAEFEGYIERQYRRATEPAPEPQPATGPVTAETASPPNATAD